MTNVRCLEATVELNRMNPPRDAEHGINPPRISRRSTSFSPTVLQFVIWPSILSGVIEVVCCIDLCDQIVIQMHN